MNSREPVSTPRASSLYTPKVVIKEYYHMKTMDENVNWTKLTHLLSSFFLNLRAPLCNSTFTSNS